MVQPVTDRYWEQDEEVVKTAMLLGAAVALPVTGWAAGMYPVETVFTGFAVLTFIGGGTILFLLCRTDIL